MNAMIAEAEFGLSLHALSAEPCAASRSLQRFCACRNFEAEPLRVLLIAAHPDDEVIGCGARLPCVREGLLLVHVTDGAPRDMRDAIAAGFNDPTDYANARREEAAAALKLAGICRSQMRALNFRDREACFHMPMLSELLIELIHDANPDLVVTHAYEGGHPDHDATAFATHAACAVLRAIRIEPVLVEMTSYHAGSVGIVTGDFLPSDDLAVISIELTAEERQFKKRLFQCFPSQRRVLGWFQTACERFRVAPRYDFTQAPHAGNLCYENFDWPLKGSEWRSLAASAMRDLKLAGPL